MSSGRHGKKRVTAAVWATLAAWLAVVLIGSSLVWAVISRVGEGLIDATVPVVANQAIANTLTASPQQSPSNPASGGDGHQHHGDDGHGHPSHHATPSATPTPTVGSSSGSSTPGGGGQHHHPPTSKPSTSPAPEHRTWSGKAGLVSVSCTASTIRLVAAQPNSGYRVEVERGSREVKVVFQGTGEGTEVEVRSVCEGGVPQFRVRIDD